MAASPEEQLATMLSNLPARTGRTLDDWKALIAASGLQKHGEVMKLLKGEHGVTHGFANLIAAEALRRDAACDPLAALYEGPKAALRPLHDAIIAFACALGPDVEIAPKQASVSLRRTKQFALITPATRTRIDLGLALKGEPAGGRLETWNAMCSHRVRLETLADFDAQVQDWIGLAYRRA